MNETKYKQERKTTFCNVYSSIRADKCFLFLDLNYSAKKKTASL